MEEQKDPAILEKIREMLAKRNAPISNDVNDMTTADKVIDKNLAHGGVLDPKEVVGLPGVPDPKARSTDPVVAAGLPGVPALPGMEPTHEEKQALIKKAMSEGKLKMADGGDVDPSELPMPADAPQESKLQAILKAIGMAGSNVADSPAGKLAGAFMNPIGAIGDVIKSPAAQNVVSDEIKAATPAVGALAGVPSAATPLPAMPTPPAPIAALPPPTTPDPTAAPITKPMAQSPDPLAQLGKADTTIPGLEAPDRQALAGQGVANQHTFGNYLAEALAGLGDAVAAKGGVKQNALGDIFNLQTQQRHEALENFDKARQTAMDHFTMKNQADQTLINNIKARGELQVSPGIAQAIGHPELANKPVAQAELVLKTDGMKYEFANKLQERKQNALKNSADEIDKALAHGGIGGTQKMTDPKSRLQMIHAQAIKNDPEAFGYHVTEAH